MGDDRLDAPPVEPIPVTVSDLQVSKGGEWFTHAKPGTDAYAGVINPEVGGWGEPRDLQGQKVETLGVVYEVLGVETFAIFRPYPPGARFGLFLRQVQP